MDLKFSSHVGARNGVLVPGTRTITLVDRPSPRQPGARPLTFTFADDVSWQTPMELARAFAAFCHEHHVRPQSIGLIALPAGWLALRSTTFPPVDDPRLLPGMVEISADELFAERLEELALAYQIAPWPDGVGASIMACHQNRIEQLQAFCGTAGIRASRIVPLSAAAMQALALPTGNCLMLLQYGTEGEIAAVSSGRVVWLGTVMLPDSSADVWRDEFRQVAMGLPSGSGRSLIALADGDVADIAAAMLGVSRQPVKLRDATAAVPQNAEQALAVMAAGARRAREAALNFIARHASEGSRDWRPIIKRGAIAAAILVCLLGYFAYDWLDARSRAATAVATLEQQQDTWESVKRLATLIDATDPWCSRQPEHMEALTAINSQFPEDGVIWLTSCEVENDGMITVVGKARTRAAVLDLLSSLESSGKFGDISRSYVRQQSAGQGLVTFSATCRYPKGDGA